MRLSFAVTGRMKALVCLADCLVALLLLLRPLPTAHGYPRYADLIPNGHSVPNPCPSEAGTASGGTGNNLWIGVGHVSVAGGGVRNQFGIDFANLGRTWNQALCLLDSDGDGRSNGVELGDPQCIWKPGQTPASVNNITHPGVCDPADSPVCAAASLQPSSLQSNSTSGANSSAVPASSLCPSNSKSTSTDQLVQAQRPFIAPTVRPRVRKQQQAAAAQRTTAAVFQDQTTRPSLHET